MENKEIIEGNKLIAEFISESKTRYSVNGDFINSEFCNNNNNCEACYYDYTEMKFHTSWDWLMPVVEKIESLGYDFDFKKQGKFTNVRFNGIIDYNCKRYDNITAIYNTVVEFIKWYNENK